MKESWSVGARSSNHGERRTEEDLDIEPWTPGSCVLKIKPNHRVEVNCASARNLPQTGNARFHLEKPATMPCLVGGQLVRNRRAWAHQRHVPAKNIKKLWQLVKTGLPKEPADRRNPFVRRKLVYSAGDPGGRRHLLVDQLRNKLPVYAVIVIHIHRSEFQKHELPSVMPDSSLAKENRALRRRLDRDRNHGAERKAQDRED